VLSERFACAKRLELIWRKWQIDYMSAGEILEKIREMPLEDWLRIQSGIAEFLASSLSQEERAQIAEALQQADEDFAHARVNSSSDLRRRFGLR
jgi:uncharacterized membrane protein